MWVTAIVETPSALVVGTHDHGVLRRDTETGEWESLGLEHASISSIIHIPGDPARLIAGVYPVSDQTTTAAVFASEDGGASWQAWDGGRAQREGNRSWAYSVAVDPVDRSRLFIGDDWAVLRSEDGGRNWDYVWGDATKAGVVVGALEVSASGDGLVWAGGETAIFEAFLLVSTDGGNTWDDVRPNPRADEGVYEENGILSLTVDPQDSHNLLAGMKFGYIIRSTDAGRTWQRVFQSPAGRPGFVWDLEFIHGDVFAAVSDNFRPPDDGQDFPLTDLGLYRSQDAGESWEAVPVPSAHGGAALSPGAHGTVLVGTHHGGLWRVRIN